MKWFKHDSDANADAKIQNVLLDYGLEGYGLYWYCIELIVLKVDEDNINFDLEHDARIIARNTGSTPQKVSEMMAYFVNVGLFESSDGVITCLKLAKRLDKSMTSNNKMRELIGSIKSNGGYTQPQLPLDSHDSVMIKSDLVMQEEKRREEKRTEKNKKATNSEPEIWHDEQRSKISDLYNQLIDGSGKPKFTKWSDARIKKLRTRCADKSRDLDWWLETISKIPAQAAAMEGDWFTLQWLLHSENNLEKFCQGNYKNSFNRNKPNTVKQQDFTKKDYGQMRGEI